MILQAAFHSGCIHTYKCAHTHIHADICTHTSTHVYTRMCGFIYVDMAYTNTYRNIHVDIKTCIHMYTYIHTHKYTRMCGFIYIDMRHVHTRIHKHIQEYPGKHVISKHAELFLLRTKTWFRVNVRKEYLLHMKKCEQLHVNSK